MDRDAVHLLVFELDGQFYGVDVDQVEAIVAGERTDGFCSYEGQDVPVHDLARWIGLDRPDPSPRPSVVSSPRPSVVPSPQPSAVETGETGKRLSMAVSRVLLSRSSGTLQGFAVDTPKNIVTLGVADLFPIPNLIQRVLGPTPLWGVGRSPGGLLLLVDLARRGTR
jgi:chemotaxis signal transduction protein